jgi:hypothetical protein
MPHLKKEVTGAMGGTPLLKNEGGSPPTIFFKSGQYGAGAGRVSALRIFIITEGKYSKHNTMD